MNNVGVFAWIRDSVRRAVLLGFSDAVEQIGGIDDKEPLHPQLAAVMKQAPALKYEPAPTPRNERKRLGRSLGQFQNEAEPNAAAG